MKSEPTPVSPCTDPSARKPSATYFVAAALRQYDVAIASLVSDVITGGDPEAIHQLRVQLAKARVALLVAGLLGAKCRNLERRLRRLRRSLAPARDWSVLVAAIDAGNYQLPPTVRKRARARLNSAVAEAKQILATPDNAKLLAELHVAADKVEALATDQPLPALAKHACRRAWRRLRRRARKLGGDNDAQHQVRLAAKRLRYLLELFAPGWPTAEDMRVLKLLRQLQTTLGKGQDDCVQRQLLVKLGVDRHADPSGAAEPAVAQANWQGLRQRWKLQRPLLGKGMKTEYGNGADVSAPH